MQRFWQPKDLIKALNEYDAVNLRHIVTRRTKGLITPIKAAGRGERPEYDAFNAMLYFVATKLEQAGLSIELAYSSASYILSLQLHECLLGNAHMWLIGINNEAILPCPNLGSENPFVFNSGILNGKRDAFVLLIPAKGIYLFVEKEKLDAMPEIAIARFINASALVHEAIVKLGLNGKEIESLKEKSRENWKEFHGIR